MDYFMEKMKKTAQWALGCFFASIGALMLHDGIYTGILFCISGIILIPPITNLIPSSFRWKRHLIIAVAIILILIAGSAIPK